MLRKMLRGAVYTLWLAATSYLLLEVSYSTLYVRGFVPGFSADSFQIHEDKGGFHHFDPLLGTRFAGEPIRHAAINNGTLVFQTQLPANEHGFPDPDAWPAAAAGAGDVLRIAVMGDSFTAAPFLDVAWTEQVEELARGDGRDWQLMNMAINGGGLGNWWSILTRYMDEKSLDCDAVVFALYDWDLDRFMYGADDTPHPPPPNLGFPKGLRPLWSVAMAPGQEASWPRTVEEAREQMWVTPSSYVVPPRIFDRAIQGRWYPGPPRPWRPYAVEALPRLWRLVTPDESPRPPVEPVHMPVPVSPDAPPAEPDGVPYTFKEGMERYVTDIAAFLERRGIPAFVLRVPALDTVVNRFVPQPTNLSFIDTVASGYFDPVPAFAALEPHELRACWFELDYHWAQPGSDRFAEWAYPRLRGWLDDVPALPKRDAQGRAAFWRSVVAEHGKQGWAHAGLARALHRAGAVSDAATKMETAIRLRVPQTHRLCGELGRWYEGAGNPLRALDTYRRAFEFDPENKEAATHISKLLSQGATVDAVSFWRAAQRAFPGSAEIAYRTGQAQAGAGASEAAVEAYRAAMDKNGGGQAAARALFDYFVELGRADEAVALARERQDQPETAPEWLYLEGALLVDNARLDEGLAAFQGAIERDPAFMPACYGADDIFKRLDTPDKRVAFWRDMCHRYPEAPRLGLHFAKALVATEAYSEAMDQLERMRAFSDMDWEMKLAFALAHAGLGEFEQAFAYGTGALAEYPDRTETVDCLVGILRTRTPEARAAIWAGLAAEHPRNHPVLLAWAQCLLDMDDFEGAVPVLEEGLELQQDFRTQFMAADAYLGVGRIDQALAACERVGRDTPGLAPNAANKLYEGAHRFIEKGDLRAAFTLAKETERIFQGSSTVPPNLSGAMAALAKRLDDQEMRDEIARRWELSPAP